MTLPKPNRTGPLGTFHSLFEQHLDTEDFSQFFSNRRNAGRDTYLRTDIFNAEKLADVILEEYGVRNKLQGNVMLTLPQPDAGIPIFFFQLGGNARKKIAMLDISPVQPDTDFAPLVPVYEKYRDLLGITSHSVDWVQSISSPYLLHREYDDLDTELFLEAMYEYLCIWIQHYYEPALARNGDARLDDAQIDYATQAIYRFKEVLHANDPAYSIFAKEWGKPVADAFFYLETRHHPSLPMPATH